MPFVESILRRLGYVKADTLLTRLSTSDLDASIVVSLMQDGLATSVRLSSSSDEPSLPIASATARLRASAVGTQDDLTRPGTARAERQQIREEQEEVEEDQEWERAISRARARTPAVSRIQQAIEYPRVIIAPTRARATAAGTHDELTRPGTLARQSAANSFANDGGEDEEWEWAIARARALTAEND